MANDRERGFFCPQDDTELVARPRRSVSATPLHCPTCDRWYGYWDANLASTDHAKRHPPKGPTALSKALARLVALGLVRTEPRP